MPDTDGLNGALKLTSDARDVGMLLDWLDHALESSGLDKLKAFRFRCAVVEVFNNCIQHAYGNETGHPIKVVCRLEPELVLVSIYDRGMRFKGPPELSASEPVAQSGRGFEIISAGVSSYRFERDNGWNICRLELRISLAGSISNG